MTTTTFTDRRLCALSELKLIEERRGRPATDADVVAVAVRWSSDDMARLREDLFAELGPAE